MKLFLKITILLFITINIYSIVAQTQNKISIVIPCYNEEKNIDTIYKELQKIIQNQKFDYEILFINDGSTDNTFAKIEQIALQNENIKGISFSRNFGHQMALTAGYDHATGDAIITMDCDLQDPPHIINELLRKWENGVKIVYARRTNRNDGFFKKITADLYYKFLSFISDIAIPRQVGDFRLIDKKVLDILKKMPERSRYLRGMVAWTGFSHDFIDFERPERFAGQSSYTWKKMFMLALDGITSFSLFPIQAFLFISLFIFVVFTLFLIYFFIFKNLPLSWILLIILFCLGLQSLAFWFFGQYVGRIYEQVRQRPLYIIEKTINI